MKRMCVCCAPTASAGLLARRSSAGQPALRRRWHESKHASCPCRPKWCLIWAAPRWRLPRCTRSSGILRGTTDAAHAAWPRWR